MAMTAYLATHGNANSTTTHVLAVRSRRAVDGASAGRDWRQQAPVRAVPLTFDIWLTAEATGAVIGVGTRECAAPVAETHLAIGASRTFDGLPTVVGSHPTAPGTGRAT